MPKTITYLKEMIQFGWPFLRPYSKRFIMGVGFGVLFAASNGLVVAATTFIVERFQDNTPAATEQTLASGATMLSQFRDFLDPWIPMIGRPLDVQQVVGGVLVVALLSAFRGMLGFLSGYCMSWASEQMIQDLRSAIVAKLNSLSLGYFQKTHSGNLITFIQKDTGNLQRAFVLGLPDAVKEPFTLIFVCMALVLMDWQLSLVAFVFFPLCAAPVVLLGMRLKKIAVRQRSDNVSQSGHFIQVMANMRIVQAFNLEKQQTEDFRMISTSLARQNIKATVAQRLANPIIETMAGLAFGVILVYVVYANYEISDLAGFLVAAVLCFSPIKKISGLNMMFQQTAIGIERLQQLFNTKSDVLDDPGGATLDGFHRELTFEHVYFSYGERQVLTDIHFSIRRGERIGIVGESGSGKSTLINLLYRFYEPTSGSIMLDGRNIKSVSLHSLRQHLALVSQDILLFNQSVLKNIAYGKSGATEAEVKEAALAAHADHFIRESPEGYQTNVGEWGSRLSGGQKQRISLARAFVRRAPILVLDEATAALDSESEKEILNAIEHLSRDYTIISVAHRLSTLRRMDRIIVLENGVIAQTGTYDELLGRPGTFRNLALHQGLTEL